MSSKADKIAEVHSVLRMGYHSEISTNDVTECIPISKYSSSGLTRNGGGKNCVCPGKYEKLAAGGTHF